MARVLETAQSLHLSKWMPSNQMVVKVSEISTLTPLMRSPLDESHLLMVLRQSLPLLGDSITDSCMNEMCSDVITTFFAGAPRIEIDIPLLELLKLQCYTAGCVVKYLLLCIWES